MALPVQKSNTNFSTSNNREALFAFFAEAYSTGKIRAAARRYKISSSTAYMKYNKWISLDRPAIADAHLLDQRHARVSVIGREAEQSIVNSLESEGKKSVSDAALAKLIVAERQSQELSLMRTRQTPPLRHKLDSVSKAAVTAFKRRCLRSVTTASDEAS